MKLKLSDHFTYEKLLIFALPTIGMVLITCTYDIIDGYFISNNVGKTAFAAVNIVYPLVLTCSAAGFMFGAGGSALIATELGKGDSESANRYLTMIIKAAFCCRCCSGDSGLYQFPLCMPFDRCN